MCILDPIATSLFTSFLESLFHQLLYVRSSPISIHIKRRLRVVGTYLYQEGISDSHPTSLTQTRLDKLEIQNRAQP